MRAGSAFPSEPSTRSKPGDPGEREAPPSTPAPAPHPHRPGCRLQMKPHLPALQVWLSPQGHYHDVPGVPLSRTVNRPTAARRGRMTPGGAYPPPGTWKTPGSDSNERTGGLLLRAGLPATTRYPDPGTTHNPAGVTAAGGHNWERRTLRPGTDAFTTSETKAWPSVPTGTARSGCRS